MKRAQRSRRAKQRKHPSNPVVDAHKPRVPKTTAPNQIKCVRERTH